MSWKRFCMGDLASSRNGLALSLRAFRRPKLANWGTCGFHSLEQDSPQDQEVATVRYGNCLSGGGHSVSGAGRAVASAAAELSFRVCALFQQIFLPDLA